MVAITLILHVGVPAALVAWAILGGCPNRLYWIARSGAIVGFAAFLWHGSGWTFVSVYLRPVVIIALVAAVLWSAKQLPSAPWWPGSFFWNGVGTTGLFLVAAFLFYAAAILVTGDELPAGPEPVDLEFPLRGENYWIVSGGSAPGGNRHLRVKDNPDMRKYRGQAYAYDVIQLNAYGTHASGLYPSDPTAYPIFGETVYAPCSGRVEKTEKDLPDLSPPDKNPDKPAGNFVFLRCSEEVRVLLAHLKQGSLDVSPGDEVKVGDPLGKIGNSGNTSEPHLHIHAQRPASDSEFMSGKPLPITFSGRFYGHSTFVARN